MYLSEAGGDPRVVGPGSIDISYNLFQDNWSGVTLWENADRYCNSPANTSSDYCTLGGAATLQTCVAGTIGRGSRTTATAGGRRRTSPCTTTSSG